MTTIPPPVDRAEEGSEVASEHRVVRGAGRPPIPLPPSAREGEVDEEEAASSWAVGQVEVGPHASDSEEPLTSGESESEDEEVQSSAAHLKLLTLEQSWSRLKEAAPPESVPKFEKRWRRAIVIGA